MAKNAPAKTRSKAAEIVPADDFSDFASAGMEGVTSDDILIPRLGIIQSLSPQLKPNKPEHIAGAQAGLIADIGVGDLFEDGVWFLPVAWRKEYLEWAPRDSGKGLQGIHSSPTVLEDCTIDDRRRHVLPNGNYIAETSQFFGFNLTANCRTCFIPMTSTQLKKGRRWLTLAKGEVLRRSDGSEFEAPLFYRSYRLSTVEESNAQGEWFGWKIERDIALPEFEAEKHGSSYTALMQKSKALLETIAAGRAHGDVSDLAYGVDDSETSSDERAM